MARIEAGTFDHEVILEVQDCNNGGDHNSLLRQTANSVLQDDRVLSSSTQCPPCGLNVVVERNPNTKVISASLEKPQIGSWAGM